MEYIYAAMLLHKAGQEINETNLKRVLEAANVTVSDVRVKALTMALQGINIDEAIKSAAVPVQATVTQTTQAETPAAPEKEAEPEKKETKEEEESAAGLSALFG
jgi:large subunit ribosomal protein L12